MPRRTLFPTPLTRLTFLLAFLLGISLNSVHAQTFQPVPVQYGCATFVEGQGLYVFGGRTQQALYSYQAFMLNLSVPWDIDRPVFKKLADGPAAFSSLCTLLPKGDEIFVVVSGIGYIYNINADSWTPLSISGLPSGYETLARADPETGLVYIIYGSGVVGGKVEQLVLNLETKTINTTAVPTSVNLIVPAHSAWSPTLRSFLLPAPYQPLMYTFSPSKVNGMSNGWSTVNVTGEGSPWRELICFAPAYNGSKMILFFNELSHNTIRILDVATQTWKNGNPTNIPALYYSSCAVSGDQFIVWGGTFAGNKMLNGTLVYNMKEANWTSTFVPSSQPTNTPDTTAPDNTKSSNGKMMTNIIVIAGVLLTVSLTVSCIYYGGKKRPHATNNQVGGAEEDLQDMESETNVSSTPGKVLSRGISSANPCLLWPQFHKCVLRTFQLNELHVRSARSATPSFH